MLVKEARDVSRKGGREWFGGTRPMDSTSMSGGLWAAEENSARTSICKVEAVPRRASQLGSPLPCAHTSALLTCN